MSAEIGTWFEASDAMKILALAFALAACGGKQSSNTSSAGGAPPPAQDTTSDVIPTDGGTPMPAPAEGSAVVVPPNR